MAINGSGDCSDSRGAGSFTRRRFLEWSGKLSAGALLAPLLGCAGPIRRLPNHNYLRLPYSARDGKVLFGLFKGTKMREMVEHVVPRMDDLRWLKQGDKVFIKVACNSHHPHPAVTDPLAVQALVGFLKDRGIGKIYVGDQAGVEHVRLHRGGRVSTTREVMKKNGLLEAVRASGATLHNFDDQGWKGYFRPKSDFAHLWQDKLYLPRILEQVDHVINLARLGTHALAGYTAAVKSAVGWLRDDSRFALHHEGQVFFERIAEISHFSPLREKLRFNLTLGRKALLDIGPDMGGVFKFPGSFLVASRRLVDHDALVSQLLPWLDKRTLSIFDLYTPYPRHSNFWNRRFVKETWGKENMKTYQSLVPPRLGRSLAHDVTLSHLAALEKYRPLKIGLYNRGVKLPKSLEGYLQRALDGLFLFMG